MFLSFAMVGRRKQTRDVASKDIASAHKKFEKKKKKNKLREKKQRFTFI